MKAKWKEVLCFLMVKLIVVQCDYFSVVASAILRIDEPYRVAITSHDIFGEKLDIKVGVQGVTNSGDIVEVFQNLTLNPGSSKILKFQVVKSVMNKISGKISSKLLTFLYMQFPNISLGLYELVAECNDFSKAVGLYINPQKVTLMIQLDKPIYKITDIVNFRVFAIDSRTKPYMKTPGFSKIWILDSRNNELKSFENVRLTLGVYENKFVFTRLQPGIYEILAEIDDTIVSKKFEIFKDSQSIYDLKLAVPERVLYRDGLLRIKISIHLSSRYALDNLHSISGMLVLTCDAMRTVKYQRIINATYYDLYEGIDFINDLGLEFVNERRTYTLKAVFIDDVTKKNFTSTAAFTIEMSDFQIQIVHSPKYFKIGIPYSFTLLVTKTVDEIPVMSSIEPIYVVVKDDRGDILIDQDFELDPNTGSVEIYTPEIPEDTLFLNIFAQYDKIQYFQQVNLSSTQRSESIAIDVLTPRPKMYERVDFELTTTSKSTSFAVFQVLSKGLLIMSNLIPLDYGYANFSITPKFSYTPKAHCIVYFITEDGDLISDSLVLNFDNQFPNFVHLNIDSTNSITPGSAFSLNVTSTLFSSVSLLAIDQRGISQRHKYDILKDNVFDNELIKYDRAAIENFYDFDIPFWFYPLSYQKTFFEVGAVILSNAVQNIPCKPDDTGVSAYDKFVIDDEQILKASKYLERDEIEDAKLYYDGFMFKTVTVKSPVDELGIKGEEYILSDLPETSATWAFTAITLNEEYGLGMTEDPFLLDSYKKFYIDFSVPAFVKVGEIFLVEILIGNLHDENLIANVQVFDFHRGFEISRPWTYGWNETDKGYLQSVEIPQFNVHRLVIEVSAETFGSYSIQIAATSRKGVESKVGTLKIIPEGFLTKKMDTIFIATENCYAKTLKTLKLNLDEEIIVDGTLDVHANVVGDLMGISLANIDAIFKEPIGNAEEILFVFSLNVLALDYLLLADQLTASIKVKIEHYLSQSYQKLIKYRNMDGSFRSFDGIQGSVWLTANVLRQLQKAQRYMEVNEDVVLEALVFIASKQESCGKFQSDKGTSLEIPVNKAQTDVAFTAFIGILFDENKKSYPQYISLLQKAVEYVELNYDKNNLYSLALVTYFMYEMGSPLKYELLQSLLSHIQDISSNEVSWKESNATSMDVEINSYCLMILDHIPELYAEAFKIVQWLLIHQNLNAKFFSTRDTIVALEAISRFASRLSDTEENLEISLAPNGDEDHAENVSIAGPLKLVKQMFMLPPTTRYLDVSAHGDGFAIVQLSCSYYVYSIKSSDAISLTTQFKEESCNDYLILSISVELALGEISDAIGVTVESPSGFVFVDSGAVLPDYVVNIEELNQGTLIHLHLKNFTRNIHFDLAFLRKFVIFNKAFSNIEVFDLNRDSIKTSAFYKASKDLPLCSNQTLTTSPPIYEFTTLEPLPTDFYRIKSTANEKEVTDELTTDMDNINFDNGEMEATSEESFDYSSEQPEYDDKKEFSVPEEKLSEAMDENFDMNGIENDETDLSENISPDDSLYPEFDSDEFKDESNINKNDDTPKNIFDGNDETAPQSAVEKDFDSHDLPDEDSVTFLNDYSDTTPFFESTADIEDITNQRDIQQSNEFEGIDDYVSSTDSDMLDSGNSGSEKIFLDKEGDIDDDDSINEFSPSDKLTDSQEESIATEIEDEKRKNLSTAEESTYPVKDSNNLEPDESFRTTLEENSSISDGQTILEDEPALLEPEDEVTTEKPTPTTTINSKKTFKKKFKPKELPKSIKNKSKPSNQNQHVPKFPPKFKKFSKPSFKPQ